MKHDGLCGENHYLWKGDNASYTAFHHWLKTNYPKTGVCEQCSKSDVRTEYALIHGKSHSHNRENYLELCSPCHNRYDHGGERSSSAKLTAEQVAEIRARYIPQEGGRPRGVAPGPREGSSVSLAKEFGVNRTTIMAIVHRKKWRDAKD